MKLKLETIKSPATSKPHTVKPDNYKRMNLRIKAATGVFLTPTTVLVMFLIVLLPLTAVLLRQNNLNMVDYRNKLVQADKSGDVAAVRRAAKHLQNYVAHHMNTTTGRIALQTLYDEKAQAVMDANKPVDVDGSRYQSATEECKPSLRRSGYRAWANCVAEKVGLSSVNSIYPDQKDLPDPDLFYVEFVPARLSFDLAGVCLVISAVGLVILLARLVYLLIKQILKKLNDRQYIRG